MGLKLEEVEMSPFRKQEKVKIMLWPIFFRGLACPLIL